MTNVKRGYKKSLSRDEERRIMSVGRQKRKSANKKRKNNPNSNIPISKEDKLPKHWIWHAEKERAKFSALRKKGRLPTTKRDLELEMKKKKKGGGEKQDTHSEGKGRSTQQEKGVFR